MKKLLKKYFIITLIFSIILNISNTYADTKYANTKFNYNYYNQNNYIKYNKHVIGAQPLSGLLSLLFATINNLAWAEANKRIPVIYWGKDCVYYQPEGYRNETNAWLYYFQPVSQATYEKADPVHQYYWAPDGSGIEFMSNLGLNVFSYIKFANNIINRYIKIRPEISMKFMEFYNQNIKGKPTIGIHIRGTDKNREAGQVNPQLLIKEANNFKGYQFFVATDEQRFLDYAKKNLKGNVISYNVSRSLDGKPIHLNSKNNKALLGEEVLIEVLLLQSCQYLIHTLSNVSTAAYFLNPNLNGILFNPWGHKFIIRNAKLQKA